MLDNLHFSCFWLILNSYYCPPRVQSIDITYYRLLFCHHRHIFPPNIILLLFPSYTLLTVTLEKLSASVSGQPVLFSPLLPVSSRRCWVQIQLMNNCHSPFSDPLQLFPSTRSSTLPARAAVCTPQRAAHLLKRRNSVNPVTQAAVFRHVSMLLLISSLPLSPHPSHPSSSSSSFFFFSSLPYKHYLHYLQLLNYLP